MKKVLPFLFSGIAVGALAQPTIQAGDFNPTIGQSFSIHRGDYVSPGSGGNNVTWDMSSMNSASVITTNVEAANAGFPGTTVTLNTVGETQLYLELSSSQYAIHGFYNSPNNLLFDYSDPSVLYEFPLSMSTNFTDDFVCTYTVNGFQFERSGSQTVTADGYGTLITPSGTFTDVLRVHIVQDYSDFNSTIGSYDYLADIYVWMKAGYHNELASVSTLTSDLGNSSYGLYLDAPTNSISESEMEAIRVFPNPVKDQLYIDHGDVEIDFIRLTDLNGKEIDVEYTKTTGSIDVSELPKGIYSLTIQRADQTIVRRIVK